MSHIAEGIEAVANIMFVALKAAFIWLAFILVLSMGTCSIASYYAYRYFTS